MLYQINHDAKRVLWCGPGAIALVTGRPTSEIYAHAEADRGRAVKGMYNGELFRVLKACGYQAKGAFHCEGNDRLTLSAWARKHAALFAKRPVIVEVGNHYGVVMGRRYVDNQTRDPIALSDSKYRRSLVSAAWFVERIGPPQPAPVKPPRVRDTAMAKARRLAAKHGIDIEREHDYYWVTCPALEHDDPHEGNHTHVGGAEVLDAVEDYVRCLTTGYLEAVTEPEHVAVALPPCPDKPVDAVAYALEHHGPDTPIGIACTLSLLHGLDIRGRQVRGAAIGLVSSGRARWRGDKLVLQVAA